jgi:hypothetical protein
VSGVFEGSYTLLISSVFDFLAGYNKTLPPPVRVVYAKIPLFSSLSASPMEYNILADFDCP